MCKHTPSSKWAVLNSAARTQRHLAGSTLGEKRKEGIKTNKERTFVIGISSIWSFTQMKAVRVTKHTHTHSQ